MSFLLKPISFLFIIFLAYFLKRAGFVKKELSGPVFWILTHVTIPAVAITAFTGIDRDLSLLWLTLIGFLASIGPYFLMFFLSRKQSREERINYIISVSGFNIGCYGMPLIQGFYGVGSAIYCIMLDVGNAIMMLGGNYAFTSALLPGEQDKEKVTAGKILKRLFSSFSMDVYLVLLVLLLLNIRIPQCVADFISPISNANAFLAMFMLGLLFTPPKNKSHWKSTIIIVVFRNVLMTAVAILCYLVLPLPEEIRKILILLLLCPIGAAAPGFVVQCGGDGEQASFANSVSTIISLIVMTVLVGIFTGA